MKRPLIWVRTTTKKMCLLLQQYVLIKIPPPYSRHGNPCPLVLGWHWVSARLSWISCGPRGSSITYDARTASQACCLHRVVIHLPLSVVPGFEEMCPRRPPIVFRLNKLYGSPGQQCWARSDWTWSSCDILVRNWQYVRAACVTGVVRQRLFGIQLTGIRGVLGSTDAPCVIGKQTNLCGTAPRLYIVACLVLSWVNTDLKLPMHHLVTNLAFRWSYSDVCQSYYHGTVYFRARCVRDCLRALKVHMSLPLLLIMSSIGQL